MEVMKECINIDANEKCCQYRKMPCVKNEELCRYYKEF